MLITPGYAKENARLHAVDPMFGAEGYLWAYQVAGVATIGGCESILDYGCGKGTLVRELNRIKGLRKFTLREYDPGVPGKDDSPGEADLVVCLDVLEHIEPDLLDNVIEDLGLLARKKLFVVISTKPSKRIMADGRDTHLSLHDGPWWAEKFRASDFTVLREWNTGLRLWVALLNPPDFAC